jgi:hypothetical protein
MSQIIFIISEDNIYQLIDRLSRHYKFKLKKLFTEDINGALLEIDSNQFRYFKDNETFIIIEEDKISRTKKINKFFNYEMYKNLLKNKQ